MTEHEWLEWVKCHRDLFQFHTEDDQKMIAAWFPLLQRYDLAELREASSWLATREGKLFRTEHLGELRRRITQKRLERVEASNKQAEHGAVSCCELCSDSGWAVVPHPRFVVGGEWQAVGNSYPTITVACRCQRGQRLHEKATVYAAENDKRKDKGEVKVPMSIYRYSEINPGWPDQMAQRLDDEAAERKAVHAARQAHGSAQRIVADLAEAKKMPREPRPAPLPRLEPARKPRPRPGPPPRPEPVRKPEPLPAAQNAAAGQPGALAGWSKSEQVPDVPRQD